MPNSWNVSRYEKHQGCHSGGNNNGGDNKKTRSVDNDVLIDTRTALYRCRIFDQTTGFELKSRWSKGLQNTLAYNHNIIL